MLVSSIADLQFSPTFADLSALVEHRFHLYAKIEGFNPGGSIKLKPAVALVAELERAGAIAPGVTLIETSSGNMGVALALVAKTKGCNFICVSDEKITHHNRKLLAAYDADLVVLEESTLEQRYEYIAQRIAADRLLKWPRQFRNPENPKIHEATTASEILSLGRAVDYLFVGVGTGGTIAGCANALKSRSPNTKIVAVDAEGSHHFLVPTKGIVRRIPGIGASEPSPFLEGLEFDDVLIVREIDAVRACLKARDATGWLLGGSSGSVLAAVSQKADTLDPGILAIAVCADFGERYLDTIYDKRWRSAFYPECK